MKKLGFGFMRLPVLSEQKDIDYPKVFEMVDTFMENGFSYFDTAYIYHMGESEIALKKALVKRYPRDKFQIATKLPLGHGVTTKEEQESVFNEHFEKLGVDYIDYYLIHNLSVRTLPMAEDLETIKFLLQKKKEGKIKKLGFSSHGNAKFIEKVLTLYPEVDFIQLQINYLDWENDIIQSKKCYEVARSHNKEIIVMEPLKGGGLVNIPDEAIKLFKDYNPNLSVASWGIRYAASLDNVMMVLSGMSNFEQLEDNTGYMRDFKPLNNEEKEIINKVIKIIDEEKNIACTSCRYCVDGCPKKIAIPEYFALYNNKQRLIQLNLKGDLYANNYSKFTENGKASECIKCKKCELVCPQHLKIIESLKIVADEFE